jgi:hypothetical protein
MTWTSPVWTSLQFRVLSGLRVIVPLLQIDAVSPEALFFDQGIKKLRHL